MSAQTGNTDKALQKPTNDILSTAMRQAIEGITGIATSETNEALLSLGHVLQQLRSGRFLQTLQKEWNRYREKGKIPEDYETSEQHAACLQELLDSLDTQLPDDKRLEVMKRIFLVASTEEHSTRADPLPLEFLRTARTLSSAEVLILNAAYALGKNSLSGEEVVEPYTWREKIAEQSGLKHAALIELYQEGLARKNLIVPVDPEHNFMMLGKHFGLTSFGHALCEFIEDFESGEQPASPYAKPEAAD